MLAALKNFFLAVGCALFIAGPLSLCAKDDSAEKRPNREEAEKRKENWKKLSPEEREAKRKEIKERLEKRITELRVKQTNQTITATEVRELGRSEQILKRFEQNAAAAKTDGSKSKEQPAPAPAGK